MPIHTNRKTGDQAIEVVRKKILTLLQARDDEGATMRDIVNAAFPKPKNDAEDHKFSQRAYYIMKQSPQIRSAGSPQNRRYFLKTSAGAPTVDDLPAATPTKRQYRKRTKHAVEPSDNGAHNPLAAYILREIEQKLAELKKVL